MNIQQGKTMKIGKNKYSIQVGFPKVGVLPRVVITAVFLVLLVTLFSLMAPLSGMNPAIMFSVLASSVLYSIYHLWSFKMTKEGYETIFKT